MLASFDTIALQKKVESSWSSWKISPQLSKDPDFISNIIVNYDKFDKKALARILLALLGVEGNNRTKCTDVIKKLLKKAAADKDEWISIVAGIVHTKLFKDGDATIEEKSREIISSTAKTILDRLEEPVETSASDSAYFYQPKENMFLIKSASDKFFENSTNQHFTFVGKRRDFLNEISQTKKNETESTAPIKRVAQTFAEEDKVSSSSFSSSSSLFAKSSSSARSIVGATFAAAPKKLEKISIDQV